MSNCLYIFIKYFPVSIRGICSSISASISNRMRTTTNSSILVPVVAVAMLVCAGVAAIAVVARLVCADVVVAMLVCAGVAAIAVVARLVCAVVVVPVHTLTVATADLLVARSTSANYRFDGCCSSSSPGSALSSSSSSSSSSSPLFQSVVLL